MTNDEILQKELNPLTEEVFYAKIEEMVKDPNVTYMDALCEYCVRNNLEVESIADLIGPELKANLAEELEAVHLIKKSGRIKL